MLVIPAIDLRDGCCVRLLRGDPRKQTVYSKDPEQVALKWERLGAKYLHIVDLDGAFSGTSVNAGAVERIATVIKIPFQLGGGLRTANAVEEAFKRGVTRVIIGTMAIENPALLKDLAAEYGERIVVGLDARNGKVAVKGWVEESEASVEELASQLESMGIKELIYTDINRDGTLKGPNLNAVGKLARSTGLSLIASGGISSLGELLELKKLYKYGVRGVIIGKALYSGCFTLPEAIKAARNDM